MFPLRSNLMRVSHDRAHRSRRVFIRFFCLPNPAIHARARASAVRETHYAGHRVEATQREATRGTKPSRDSQDHARTGEPATMSSTSEDKSLLATAAPPPRRLKSIAAAAALLGLSFGLGAVVASSVNRHRLARRGRGRAPVGLPDAHGVLREAPLLQVRRFVHARQRLRKLRQRLRRDPSGNQPIVDNPRLDNPSMYHSTRASSTTASTT